MRLRFTAPVKTVSESNTRQHWSVRHRRFKAQREIIGLLLGGLLNRKRLRFTPPFTVTLTRHGSRRLDSDNLQASLKACRDEIAARLGVDDGDERVTWRYRQEASKEYAVTVEIIAGA